MSPGPEYLRLGRLLHHSLHRFSDLASNTFTPEIEKDLLIALSQVFRQVKQLIDELNSDEELLEDDASDGECLIDATAHLDNRHYLAVITGDLMLLLAFNSHYVQHLVGNTLVAISEFLLASECDWDDFMQLLCLCLELAICNILKSSSISAYETRYLDFNPSTTSSLKLKLESSNWSVVAAISRIIRNIQKCLKQDCDEKCMKTYLDSVSSLLINFPWDLLREIYVSHYTEYLKGSAEDVLLKIVGFQLREMTTFFGHCIQLLCSLVTQSSYLEVELGFSPIIWRIIDLVPILTLWCQVEVQSPFHVRISHYFRHKVLMLMVKLSSTIHIGETISNKWMHLLHKYFEDLLLQPISGSKFDQDGFLEGSPFCTSIFNPEKHNIPSFHLQRLAILLFLKCSLNLVRTGGSSNDQQRMHENLKHYCYSELNLDSEFCSDSIGLTELHKWLQSHIPADILLNDELYFERCVRFTLSFIQLFMHEDDILFEMLLQLFHVPFVQECRIIKDEPLAEVKNHLAVDLFNPIHLFHLFLAEISYDHQVLLDYLISKDTGSSCAEYFLRSLRIICSSWSLFVEFPGVKDDSGQLCVKRRKVLADSRGFKGEIYPAPLKEGGIPSREKEFKEGYTHGSKSCINFKLPFVAARDCLTSLTTSIDSLNKKSLFPYNPQVLLRRLAVTQLGILISQYHQTSSAILDRIIFHQLTTHFFAPHICNNMRFSLFDIFASLQFDEVSGALL